MIRGTRLIMGRDANNYNKLIGALRECLHRL